MALQDPTSMGEKVTYILKVGNILSHLKHDLSNPYPYPSLILLKSAVTESLLASNLPIHSLQIGLNENRFLHIYPDS
jgi:hypothetical protein